MGRLRGNQYHATTSAPLDDVLGDQLCREERASDLVICVS